MEVVNPEITKSVPEIPTSKRLTNRGHSRFAISRNSSVAPTSIEARLMSPKAEVHFYEAHFQLVFRPHLNSANCDLMASVYGLC